MAASIIYSAVEIRSDLNFLRSFKKQDEMFEWAIFERAKRGDLSAANSIIELLSKDESYWWQAGRYIWNEHFTSYLSKTISEIKVGSDENVDYILSELLMELEQDTSSNILLDNWDKVKDRNRFLQAAMYTSNPKLLELVHEEVKKSTEPQEFFKFILMAFGHRTTGRKGITKLKQIKTLWSYREYLSDMDISSIWDECNKNKYFEFRRLHIDDVVSKTKYFSTTSIDYDTLEKAYGAENNLYWLDLNMWDEKHIESGFEHSELVSAIIKWFETKRDIKSFNIVYQIATKIFTRKDIVKFRDVAVELDEIEKPFQDLEFYIKLRSLY